MPKLFSNFGQCQPGFVYDCTYKYRPFSHLGHRHCTCIKKSLNVKKDILTSVEDFLDGIPD